MMNNQFPGFLSLLLLLSCWGLPLQAQDDKQTTNQAKPQKLFESDQTLEITLYAPWRDVVTQKKNQNPYSANVEYTDDLGQTHKIPLTISRRGITRQTVCKYPPIKMRFDKEKVKGTVFRGQGSLKLVTHCDKGDRWEQYYIKEMLAYRMYNLITDLSFKVRPLSITYIDSQRNSSLGTHFGFLIEDDSDVAKRNNLIKLDIPQVNHSRLDSREITRFALFQYMIANVDWSALKGPGNQKCCHNARLFKDEAADKIYSIPYDFDSSGFVDAHYAAPGNGLPINQVTQRLYRGYCLTNPDLEPVRQEFLDHEQAIMAVLTKEPLLNKRNLKVGGRYLGEFFDTLKSPKYFDKSIIQKCRK